MAKAAFKAVGFKWKSMKNDPVAGTRKELMAIKKPAEGIPDFENPRNLNPGQEPLTVKAGIILELSKISDG